MPRATEQQEAKRELDALEAIAAVISDSEMTHSCCALPPAGSVEPAATHRTKL